MERLVRLATVLHGAGSAGVPAPVLFEVAGFAGHAGASDQLLREFRHLRAQGWVIENIAEQGAEGRYRMTSVDNRLRVKLSDAQQAALRRAALLANRADLAERLGLPADQAPPDPGAALAPAGGSDPAGSALTVVTTALRLSCRIRFRYKGSERVVHPASVRSQNGVWYLRGRQEGDELVKSFVISRMSEVATDDPGTAQRPRAERHEGLHPMTWQIDPPAEVVLRVPPEHVADVRRWLLEPDRIVERADAAELTYTVTNRAALRSRLYELGTRVEVLGSAEVRAELLAELAEMAGE